MSFNIGDRVSWNKPYEGGAPKGTGTIVKEQTTGHYRDHCVGVEVDNPGPYNHRLAIISRVSFMLEGHVLPEKTGYWFPPSHLTKIEVNYDEEDDV